MLVDLTNKRYEIKYRMRWNEIAPLHARLSQYMRADTNGPDTGYFNHSIYFDSPYYRMYLEKHEGYSERTKVRLRCYRPSPTAAPNAYFLELKNRRDRLVSKERMEVSKSMATELLQPWSLEFSDAVTESPVLSKFYYLIKRFGLQPHLTVLYHRRAYTSEYYPNLRITYDTLLQSSWSTSTESGPHAFRYFLTPANAIVEIKYNDRVPAIVLDEVRVFKMKQVTFSKFALALEANSGARESIMRADW